jgi:hypothetical protein
MIGNEISYLIKNKKKAKVSLVTIPFQPHTGEKLTNATTHTHAKKGKRKLEVKRLGKKEINLSLLISDMIQLSVYRQIQKNQQEAC